MSDSEQTLEQPAPEGQNQVVNDRVIKVKCCLRDGQNEVLVEEVVFDYLHGGYGDLFQEIEQALAEKSTGYKTSVQLEPEQAFGEYDAQLLKVADPRSFDDEVEEGMCFVEEAEEGEEERLYTITDITPEAVILDGNHPLAGMCLRFELEILSIRAADDQELQRGTAFSFQDEEGDPASFARFNKKWMSIELSPTLKKTTLH